MTDLTEAKSSEVAENADVKHFTRVIPREEWGALPPLETLSPLKPPIRKIHFSYHRNWPQCFNQEECSRTLRLMQLREMNERGLPDVRHNFMVGHDCNVYEGRGWKFKPIPVSSNPPITEFPKDITDDTNNPDEALPPLPPDNLEEWDDKAIDIGLFSEDPNKEWPFGNMYNVIEEFISYAIENKLMVKKYKIL